MDMVRSLGLVDVVLVVWMWLVHPRTPDPIREVAWWPVAQSAASSAEYEVLAPPETFGWRATSARVEPEPDGTVVWRVGYYTPAEEYAALLQRGVFPEQAQGSVDDWVAEQTRNGVAAERVTIGGVDWVRMEGDPTPDERRSLVARSGGTATVVTGSAPWSELELLAATLRPVAP
jgi:hypothetical protein